MFTNSACFSSRFSFMASITTSEFCTASAVFHEYDKCDFAFSTNDFSAFWSFLKNRRAANTKFPSILFCIFWTVCLLISWTTTSYPWLAVSYKNIFKYNFFSNTRFYLGNSSSHKSTTDYSYLLQNHFGCCLMTETTYWNNPLLSNAITNRVIIYYLCVKRVWRYLLKYINTCTHWF